MLLLPRPTGAPASAPPPSARAPPEELRTRGAPRHGRRGARRAQGALHMPDGQAPQLGAKHAAQAEPPAAEGPRNFEGFDSDRIRGRDAAALRELPALSNLRARKSLAFVGPRGIRKAHLAQTYGRACCLGARRTTSGRPSFGISRRPRNPAAPRGQLPHSTSPRAQPSARSDTAPSTSHTRTRSST